MSKENAEESRSINRVMSLPDILRLERKIVDDRVRNDILRAKRKNRQDALNAGILIITEQMKLSTMALFAMAISDE
jgi:hypothetical protein